MVIFSIQRHVPETASDSWNLFSLFLTTTWSRGLADFSHHVFSSLSSPHRHSHPSGPTAVSLAGTPAGAPVCVFSSTAGLLARQCELLNNAYIHVTPLPKTFLWVSFADRIKFSIFISIYVVLHTFPAINLLAFCSALLPLGKTCNSLELVLPLRMQGVCSHFFLLPGKFFFSSFRPRLMCSFLGRALPAHHLPD